MVKKNAKIKSLTGIRGIASLFVVIHHFYCYYFINTSNKASLLRNQPWSTFFFHGYLSVDVFFQLSAFVITLSSAKYFESDFNLSNYKIFMQKRWIRIYPSYFVTILFGFIFILNFHRPANFILSLTLLNLAFGINCLFNHLWSLSAEWITYLLYPLFYKFSKLKSSGYWKYLLVLLGFIILYVNSAIDGKVLFLAPTVAYFYGYHALFRCFGDYMIGMGAFYIVTQDKLKYLYSNLASILIAVTMVASLFSNQLSFVTILMAMLLIINVAYDSNWFAVLLGSKPIYFLGIISYPLYLLHYLVFEELDVMSKVLSSWLHISNLFLCLFIVYLICSLVIATLFTYIFEQPTINYLNRLIKNQIHKEQGQPINT